MCFLHLRKTGFTSTKTLCQGAKYKIGTTSVTDSGINSQVNLLVGRVTYRWDNGREMGVKWENNTKQAISSLYEGTEGGV